GAVAASHALGQGTALLPDLQTVLPLQLQVVNKQQREWLRFSNGVANTGDGPWQLRPEFPNPGSGLQQKAYQQLLDADGKVVSEVEVSSFEFHPEHNHWHIDGIALFELRQGSPTGPVVGNNSIKTTFCLIDWYKLEGPSKSPDRTYFECDAEVQGLSVGWVDQYHQSLPGQSLELTGVAPGRYYLVSTAGPDGNFIEKNYDNNTAWVGFDLTRDSKGNAKIRVVENSPCDTQALCGVGAPNR
ncbi:MAG: lysyl oxidase family protein, partial [Verrucomicrobiota bacterium]